MATQSLVERRAHGENVDQFNLDERIFHRLPAVAERLWSPDTVSDVNDARIRMAELRCKLLRRIAVRAGPVFPTIVMQNFEPLIIRHSFCDEICNEVNNLFSGFDIFQLVFSLSQKVLSLQAASKGATHLFARDDFRLLPNRSPISLTHPLGLSNCARPVFVL